MNQKLIMEGWRSFLLEDARNQEAGILTGAYMRVMTNAVSSAYEFSKETRKPSSLLSISAELGAVDRDIKSYIDKSSAKNSKFLDAISSFNLIVETKEGKTPFMIAITSGSFNVKNKMFNVEITISGELNTDHLKNNMSWINKTKLGLQELCQHELEHVAQVLSGRNIAADLESSNIASGNDTRGLVQKIKDFFFKPKNESGFKKQLDGAKQIIDQLNKSNKKGAVGIITYYTQPAEIEAYAVGFVRKAKISAANIIKQDKSKKSVKNKLVQEEFFKLFDNHTRYLLNIVDGDISDENTEELKKYIEKISDEMMNYAYDRYGFMRK
jgi:hypothetical protein